MDRVLLSWLGRADIKSARESGEAALGPTASVIAAREFDALVLLSNYSKQETEPYLAYLREIGSPKIHVRDYPLDDPTDHAAIYEAVTATMEWVEATFGVDTKYSFHISPGTPAMHAIWVLVSKTARPVELLKSHEELGINKVEVPFDIAAEYVPGLHAKAGARLQKLAAGLPLTDPKFEEIIHRSPEMNAALVKAKKAASMGSLRVLIQGESGTGKELVARAIHNSSSIANGPLVVVNCGAIPPNLVESQLFGHEKGAFTGADRQHIGYFESAHRGTLFLDEIGELPLALQVTLLRVIEDQVIRRVGGSQEIKVKVRVIAATNQNLVERIAAGEFREDLYYRLAVGIVRLPPLRERRGDISFLLDYFLDKLNDEMADSPSFVQKELSAGAKSLLIKYQWPGNVRELENTILRLLAWTDGQRIEVDDVREALLESPVQLPDTILGRPLGSDLKLREIFSEVARHYISRALKEADGNKRIAAASVGLGNYQTLTNWMKQHDVSHTGP